jgi:hypothetical protein
MNSTTKIIMEKQFKFPTVCCGIGKGKGFKTLTIDVKLARQMCRDWDTMQDKEMYVFTASGNGMGRWGQCLDTFKKQAEPYIITEEKRELFNRIVDIWSNYHLNEMQSGTKTQTEILLNKDRTLHYASRYAEACKFLYEKGRLYDKGYKYGSGWLCKPIQVPVIDEILTWKYIENEPREIIEAQRKQLYRELRKREATL